MLKGKNIILGITGSIAAYKAAILVRLLVKEGANVKVLMTPLAKEFITPLTMATLSKNPILVDFVTKLTIFFLDELQLINLRILDLRF